MFGRHKRLGHAKQMAYLVERPARQAKRAQEALAKKPPREVPPSPPPPKIGLLQKARDFIVGDKVQMFQMYGPDSFGLVHRHKPEVNKNPFRDGYSFCHRLEKKGWKLLGSGAHSKVFAKDTMKDGPSKKVIKVGCSGDSWMRYVLWGRKNGYEGTFVPKVHSYKYFKKGGFYVALVERMERCSSEEDKEKDTVLLKLFRHANRNDYAKASMNFLEKGCGDFARTLVQAANDNRWSLDIHGGNFMVRKDGTFVATDPVNFHDDTPTERIRAA